MTMIEDRLEEAARDVRQAMAGVAARSAGQVKARRQRQNVVAALTVTVVVAAGFLAVERAINAGSMADPVPPPVAAAPADDTTPNTVEVTPAPEKTEVARYWAAVLANWVDAVGRMNTFGPYERELGASPADFSETGDARTAEGALAATVISADAALTVTAEFHKRAEDQDGRAAMEAEVSELMADDATRHVDTIGHGHNLDSELTGEVELAEYFLTEPDRGSALMTVVFSRGRLEVKVDATDPSQLLTQDQIVGIATGMTGTAHSLIWDPDHSLTFTVWEPPEPTDDQWVPLDDDVSIAWVDEGGNDRLWVRTDIQEPTPAVSSDTRSMNAYAGDEFVVIVLGPPIPDFVTVIWDDGSSESSQLDWDTELDIGLARFQARDAALVSVEGP